MVGVVFPSSPCSITRVCVCIYQAVQRGSLGETDEPVVQAPGWRAGGDEGIFMPMHRHSVWPFNSFFDFIFFS